MKRLGNLLTTLLSVAALGLTGCADSEEAVVEVSAPPAPVVPETRSEPIAYVEYLQCKFGPNYSAESFGPYLAAWNAEVDGMTDPPRGLCQKKTISRTKRQRLGVTS